MSLLSFLSKLSNSTNTAQLNLPLLTLSTGLPVEVRESKRYKRATGRLLKETAIINLPQTWSNAFKQKAVDELIVKLEKAHLKQHALLEANQAHLKTSETTLSIQSLEALEAYIQALNASTFQAPLRGIRIGRSKLSHLAQVNLRTGVMTVSRYCLGERIPAEGFRYLILHELAHFQEANHSSRFWRLVEAYCPDYKYQRQVMRLYFRHNQ